MFQLHPLAMRVVRVAVLLLCTGFLQSCAWLSQKADEPGAQQQPAAAQSAEIAEAFRKRVKPTLDREQRSRTPTAAPVAAAIAPAAPAFAPAYGGGAQAYRIGVGDRVRIDVRGEPDLSVEFAVGQTGTINYPFLGDLPVAGQTVDQLQDRIDRGLRSGYLVNPDVRVLITEYRKFYINGEVKAPGGYSFIAGLTVRQAAALAGGFTERASMNKITVYREATPAAPQAANLDTPVNPGDTVVVAQGLF